MEKQSLDVQLEKSQSSDKVIFTIENYKSIEKVSLTLSDVTVVIGRNNSGKTNIMQAIVKAFDGQSIEEKDFRDKNNPCVVTVDYYGTTYESKATVAKPKFIVSQKGEDKKEVAPFSLLYIPAIPDTKDVNVNQKTKIFGKLCKEIEFEVNDEIQDIIRRASNDISKIDKESTKVISDYLSSNLKRQDLNIEDLEYKSSDVDKDAFLKARRLVINEKGVPHTLDWEEMGQGTQRMIIMYMFKQLAEKRKEKGKGSKEFLLFVEEPEIFMHPQQQLLFADDIYKPEYRAGVKLVISTHSPLFINHFSLDGLRIVQKNKGISKINNNGEPIEKYWYKPRSVDGYICENDELYQILARFHHQPLVKNMFFAKKVLLVEGDTEEILIPHLLEELKFDYLTNQVVIINTKTNTLLKKYAEILKSYSIPFVVAMDNDLKDSQTMETPKVELESNARKSREYKDGILSLINKSKTEKLVCIDGDFCNLIGINKPKAENAYRMIYTNMIRFNDLHKNIQKYIKGIKDNLEMIV